MLRLLWLGTLLAGWSSPAALAQPTPTLTFRTLTTTDGLAENSVYTVLQDRRGFLWLGSRDGLNRYDGSNVWVFRNDPKRPTSLSRNFVISLAEDHSGQLWVATGSKGLCRYNPLTNQFQRFQAGPTVGSLVSNFIQVVFCDRAGRIWVGTEEGLSLYEPSTNQFRLFRQASALPANARRNAVRTIAQTPAGALWVGTGEGRLCRLNEHAGLLEPEARWQPTSAITALCADRQGGFWVGTEADGLRYLGPGTASVRVFRASNRPGSLPDDKVRALLLDQKQNLWVGTTNGLGYYERATGTFTSYRHQPGQMHSLPNNNVHALGQDRTGLMWVCTENGVSSFEAQPSSFTTLPVSTKGATPVWAVGEDAAGRAWVGTGDEGLICYNPKTGQRRQFRHDDNDAGSLSADYVRVVYVDRKDRIWVGTQSQGLDCLLPGATRFVHYRHDPTKRNTISDNAIRSICEDTEGRLWIGTEGGLNRYDFKTGLFTAYQHDPANPSSLSNNFVHKIFQDHLGRMWLGTGGGGLCLFDPVTERFRAYQANERVPRSISADFVRTIAEDHAGQLWVGTEGGGLCRLDNVARGLFTVYREAQGLPEDVVFGILEDEQHQLWLSSNKGLVRFTPATGEMHTFDSRDGLPQNEFNVGAYHHGRSGQLYFGGANGVVMFRSAAVRTNPTPPPVVFTNLRKFNQAVELD
ncbi:two-component regulator propeller domain-containing protein, partial [Hymenobacter sp. BT491]|uniref:ligand-binding sensor domain-containing protein n=1 Tax=Hymenobacter sp. BT491 TaxID=2766779 RepID=UPI00199B7882